MSILNFIKNNQKIVLQFNVLIKIVYSNYILILLFFLCVTGQL